MYDRILRGGTVADGTGAPTRTADIAIQDGSIAAVGRLDGAAREEIDADGLLVTPGFVDIHTHYDGQATWDPELTPSTWHGVTTVVVGNCGVGFAPVRPGQEDFLIGLMEGVEDIPGAALHEGIDWQWETFPEYLDALDRHRFVADVGTQVPHGAVRAYVMGERGAKNEPATPEDIAKMAAIVKEGIAAGALGFSTSRTIAHRAVDGEPVPGTFAAEDELFGIGRVLGELGQGVFELAGAGAAGEDVLAPKKEMDWMRRLSAEIRRPVTFAMLQVDAAPQLWSELLELSAAACEEGADILPQVAGRPFGMLMGHQTDINPFRGRPSYEALLGLPLPELAARLRDTEVRARILGEPAPEGSLASGEALAKLFQMGDPPDYEPRQEDSIAARAARKGVPAEELLYDLMLEDDARELLLFPVLNYSEFNCDPIRKMLLHPRAALGLGDGGAHCGIICDASIPTFMLAHWVRDRKRGERLPVEFVIQRMTQHTAQVYGLRDRGTLEPGMRADVNLIDMDRVRLRRPEMVHDLPAGGKRLLQKADGYVASLVAGEVVMREGEATGARPGRLVRGAQSAPGKGVA